MSKKKAATKKIVKPAVKKAAVKKVAKKAVAKAPAKKAVVKKVANISTPKKAVVAKKSAAKKVVVKKVVKKKVEAAPIPAFKNTPLLKKPSPIPAMNSNKDERTRYSSEELKEFEAIILDKLDTARKQFQFAKEVLNRKNDEGTDNTTGNVKLLEDGADVLEKESFSAFAARQQKFILQLENAIARIKNGTYGVCVVTGKLIPKERLKLVPHTQHTIEAKQQRK